MSRVKWAEGAFAHSTARPVPVERFLSKARRTAWLLGDLVVWATHFRRGESSKPCLKPDACPLCDAAEWRYQLEGYVPALVHSEARDSWVACVVVLTAGALKQFGKGPFRGRMVDFWRQAKGDARVLKFEDKVTIEPPVPGFDVRPHVHQLWFPGDALPKVDDVPAPIPIEPAEVLRATAMDPAERAKAAELLRAHMAAERAKSPQTPTGTDPSAAGPSSDDPARAGKIPPEPEKRRGAPKALVSDDPGAPPTTAPAVASDPHRLPDPAFDHLDDAGLEVLRKHFAASPRHLPHLADVQREIDRRKAAAEAAAKSATVADLVGGIGYSVDDLMTMGTASIVNRGVRDALPEGHPSKPRGRGSNGHANGHGKAKGGVS